MGGVTIPFLPSLKRGCVTFATSIDRFFWKIFSSESLGTRIRHPRGTFSSQKGIYLIEARRLELREVRWYEAGKPGRLLAD